MAIKRHDYNLDIRATSYDDILVKLFIVGAAEKKALFSDTICTEAVGYNIKKAIANGHIKEETYREKHGDRYYHHKYLTITSLGISYLIKRSNGQFTSDALLNSIPWIKDLDPNVPRLSILPGNRTQQAVVFSTRVGNTILMAMNLNAVISNYYITRVPEPYNRTIKTEEFDEDDIIESKYENDNGMNDQPDDEYNSYNDIYIPDIDITHDNILTDLIEDEAKAPTQTDAELRANLWNYRKTAYEGTCHGQQAIKCEAQLGRYFITISEIKAQMENANIEMSVKDTAYSKCIGILTAPITTVLLYHAKRDGIVWNEKNEYRDIRLGVMFCSEIGPYANFNSRTATGAILVYNEKVFCDIITGHHLKKNKDRVIGNTFNRVHLIPISTEGRDLLSFIMDYTYEDLIKVIDDSLLSNNPDVSIVNRDQGAPFRWKGDQGEIFNGVFMETKLIFMAKKHFTTNKGSHPLVACLKWQESFYKRLWPDASFVFVDA